MSSIRSMPILVLAGSLVLAGAVHSQVSVQVSLPQGQFLRDESLPVEVRITNRSGQDLKFAEGDWLTFFIERKDGPSVLRKQELPPEEDFTLESSLVATRRIDLMPYFRLSEPGRYTVTAQVKIRQWDTEISSKPKSFDITRGTTFWEQNVGVPVRSGRPEVRRYALVQANNFKTLRLYLRITDAPDLTVFRVLSLGPLVSFSRPEAQVDKQSDLHVLFQTGARAFLYYRIDPRGKVLLRQTHDYFGSRPRLSSNAEGKIFVRGGTRRKTRQDIPPPTPPTPPGPASRPKTPPS